MRDYSLKIAEMVKQFLDDDDWRYKFDEENGVVNTGMKLNCKFQRADVSIRVNSDTFLVLFILPVNADEDIRPKVLDFINRANYGLIRGGFEMDVRDGEVRFRTSHYCGENCDMICADVIKDAIYLNYSMVERYGSELMAVMMGFMEPEEAIEKADNK
ncbi:MAG: YbjN domain-containing protein [Oscillospiraceae bacterium]|nr:YbjN domain-containing protein [Oscillospiraceae bacterium]